MTKEQVLQKIEEKIFTEKDLMEYYQIKSLDALEFALEEKFKVVTKKGDFLNSAFSYIYTNRIQQDYNPIQERYFFYAMVLQGLYGIDSDEITIIAYIIGAFKTVMLLEKLLEKKEEVIFFQKLYNQYIEKTESVYLKLNELLSIVNNIFKDFKVDDLEKYTLELRKAVDKIAVE
jgi:hypothetical protein